MSVNNKNYNLDISILDLIKFLWQKKITIIIITSIFAVFSIFFALSLPNVYKSQAILISDEENNLFNIPQQYSSIASITGIDIADQKASLTTEAIQRMKSYKFFEKFIYPKIDSAKIMAVKSWDISSNKINFDNKIYDDENKIWTRKVKFPKTPKPSMQEVYKYISENNFSVYQDDETDLVIASFNHHSPEIAFEYINYYINGINKAFQEEDKLVAKKKVEYLQGALIKSQLSEVKQAISVILESEYQKLTLVEGDKTYIFDIVDEPYIPELKYKPSRAIICILITILGGFISVLYVLFQSYSRGAFGDEH